VSGAGISNREAKATSSDSGDSVEAADGPTRSVGGTDKTRATTLVNATDTGTVASAVVTGEG
jgi:hypothetical protein